MKKWIIIMLFVFTHFYPIVNINAIEQEDIVVIEQYEEDLTGDGRKESIFLKGHYLSKHSNFFQNVWLEITDQDLNKWQIDYGSAYEPTLTLVDLYHEHTPHLLFQKLEEHDETIASLHSLQNEELQAIPLPKHDYTSGEFKAYFTVSLQLFPHRDPIFIEVDQNASKYIEENIYNKAGELLTYKTITIPDTVYYEPVYISQSKRYGLKSYQSIYGLDHFDKLGTIETLWYVENNDWRQLQTNFFPVEANNLGIQIQNR